MFADESLDPLPPFDRRSHPRAADDLWLPTNNQLAWCVTAATGLTVGVVWLTGPRFVSMIVKVAWLYVVTGTHG
jgi:hypothetical protein